MARRITKKERIVIPYTPRPLQREIHAGLENKRFGVLVTHRRFGKTVLGVNHIIKAALNCKLSRPQFAYVAPTYGQAKRTAWDYAKFYTDPLNPRVNENELRIDIPQNDARIYLLGADNMDALRGIYLDGAILDEYGTMRPGIYMSVIRPALSDRQGWCIFTGTPNTKNEFYDQYLFAKEHPDDYFLGVYKASKTGIIPGAELEMLKRQMSKEVYDREFECSFEAPVEGAFYTREIDAVLHQNRLTAVPYDPMYPVETWSDIGIADATATWFTQTVGREVRVIRYEEYHTGLPEILASWQSMGYFFASHNGPHDLAVREFGSGRSRIETAANLGVQFHLGPNVAFIDGINAAKTFFPMCVFDEKNCRTGWEALKNYRRRKNVATGEFTETAVHDWASHGADAFRYLALGHKFTTAKQKRDKRKPRGGLSWI